MEFLVESQTRSPRPSRLNSRNLSHFCWIPFKARQLKFCDNKINFLRLTSVPYFHKSEVYNWCGNWLCQYMRRFIKLEFAFFASCVCDGINIFVNLGNQTSHFPLNCIESGQPVLFPTLDPGFHWMGCRPAADLVFTLLTLDPVLLHHPLPQLKTNLLYPTILYEDLLLQSGNLQQRPPCRPGSSQPTLCCLRQDHNTWWYTTIGLQDSQHHRYQFAWKCEGYLDLQWYDAVNFQKIRTGGFIFGQAGLFIFDTSLRMSTKLLTRVMKRKVFLEHPVHF